ncbi:MAG: hypothetical protein ABGZ53_37365, partial [Fuerstiella sp.]
MAEASALIKHCVCGTITLRGGFAFLVLAHAVLLGFFNRDNNMSLSISFSPLEKVYRKGNEQMMKNLWNDESGVILSAELVLIGTILVLGMIVGLVNLQVAVVHELADLGDAFGNLSQSYNTSGLTIEKT